MNLTRVWAIVLRHIFMMMHQVERFTDAFLFPIFSLILWGFVSNYIGINSAGVASFLMGGLILWIMFERIGTSVGLDFMFDVWERNIVNVLATPISILEYVFGLVSVSILKVIISLIAMWLVAGLLFGFSLNSLGIQLVLLWINIVIFAISLGIFNISIVLRFGNSIAPLTWFLPFSLQPFSAVFYPVSTLPPLLQRIGSILPITYVFEGMRQALATGHFEMQSFTTALILNVIYFILSVGFFSLMFNTVRKKGTLVKL